MEYSTIYTELFREAHSIVLDVYKATQQFPPSEVFGLSNQFRRAAVSVAANLAEGYRKVSIKDKLRVYNISICSLEECRYFSLLAKDLAFMESTELQMKIEGFGKRLYHYCKGIEARL